jgi:hypothetical protein
MNFLDNNDIAMLFMNFTLSVLYDDKEARRTIVTMGNEHYPQLILLN